jgi:hypothetical protein
MKNAVKMGSGGMIYVRSFMKFYVGVQAILPFCLSNLKGYNVVIIDGRDV